MITYGTDNGAVCSGCQCTVWEYKVTVGGCIVAALCWSCHAKRWFPMMATLAPVTYETTAAQVSLSQRYAAEEGCHYTLDPHRGYSD